MHSLHDYFTKVNVLNRTIMHIFLYLHAHLSAAQYNADI